jgi:hypothetical protein
MTGSYRLVWRATALMIIVASGAWAQDAADPGDAVTQLQAKSVLTEEEQAALRAWVAQRVQVIASGDAVTGMEAVAQWRGAYQGTAEYKRAFAAASVQAMQGAYRQAKRDTAARMITLVNTLDDVAAQPLLIETLRDERVPVRTAGAIGLRRLQAQIVNAGGTAVADTLRALRDAGTRETSPVTLQLIYGAMNYTSLATPPDPKVVATAVAELLVARGDQYASRNVGAEGADRVGLELAAKVAAQLDDQGRQRLVAGCARMLRYGVERYTSELHKIDDKTSSPLRIELRDRMELFIMTAESLLAQLSPPPDGFTTVSAEMQNKEAGPKVTDMKIAMNAWADLLQQRFQFDVHLEAGAAADEEP